MEESKKPENVVKKSGTSISLEDVLTIIAGIAFWGIVIWFILHAFFGKEPAPPINCGDNPDNVLICGYLKSIEDPHGSFDSTGYPF